MACYFIIFFSGKIVSPKWKNFRGIKVKLKDKIRLNNIIWREWHRQCMWCGFFCFLWVCQVDCFCVSVFCVIWCYLEVGQVPGDYLVPDGYCTTWHYPDPAMYYFKIMPDPGNLSRFLWLSTIIIIIIIYSHQEMHIKSTNILISSADNKGQLWTPSLTNNNSSKNNT